MITRIISGVIGIVLAVYVIQEGGQTFSIAAAVLAILAWFEYTRAFSHRGGSPALFSGLLGIGGMLYGAYMGQLELILLALMGSAVLALITAVLMRGDVCVCRSRESATLDCRLHISLCCVRFQELRT